MSKKKQLAKAFAKKPSVIATGIAISLMAAQSVYAQQATPEKFGKIEVTGTRIPAPNLEGPSPVTTFDSTAIKTDGLRNVEDILNNLPQVFADYGGNLSNGASGTATVNLRNLGNTRTLVLINGRRLPAGDPGFYPADLNQVPAPLIKRVDILTGGASSVYGSDAIAGVVNFVMNDNFQGVQLQVNNSWYNHQQQNPAGIADLVRGRAATNPAEFRVPGNVNSDGKVNDMNLTMGSNFADGKGNATVFFSYTRTQKLLQSQRDFSACSLSSGAAGFTCGGSSTNATGRFSFDNLASTYTVDRNTGQTRPFNAATDQYNFAPSNYYQRPDERYNFNAFAHYDVSDKHRVYSEFGFMDDHTDAQIAPSGAFAFLPFTIFSENPLLSPAQRTLAGFGPVAAPGQTANLLLARRNVEGGGRDDDIRHTSFRGVMGVKGQLPYAPNWNYDLFMQYGQVVYQETYKNDFSKARIANAIDVVTDPATGLPACRSQLAGTQPTCAPWNFWAGVGGPSQASLAYLQTPGFKKGNTSQSVQGGTVSSDLGNYGIKAPLAKDGVSIALGVERRVEKVNLDTDTEFSTFDLAGQGGPTIGLSGQYTVREVFAELRAPLIQDQPFAKLVSINAAYRNSQYSTNQSTDSYGFGAEWAPIQQARFRGSYQKAARAANVIELFQANGLNLFNNTPDPCSGPAPAASAAACANSGVPAALYGRVLDSPAGQYNYLQGGNQSLKPETSDSYTVGVVLQPMRNLSATIDYFDIKVSKQIGIAPPSVILSQCLATGNPLFCGLIRRNALGDFWSSPSGFITATNANLGRTETAGLDFGANYTHKLSQWGGLNMNFVGTYLQKFVAEPIPGTGSYDCKGLYGPTCGTPLPEWRHKARLTWNTPWNLDLAATWRYMSSVHVDATSSNPQLNGPVNNVDRTLGARNYFDLFAQYQLTKVFSVSGGVNNLLDKDPPIASSTVAGAPFGNGNTYPQVYDTLGRRLFVNVTAKW